MTTETHAAAAVWLWRAMAFAALLLVSYLLLRSMTWMPGRSYSGTLDPLSEQETQTRDRLRGHVQLLAGSIGERNLLRYDELKAAAKYIREELESMGQVVREHPYTVEGREIGNLEIELPGKSRPGEIVLVGAHYDSVFGSPGANDNASGVAALLELARWALQREFAQTLRFVAFVNEEPPFFKTERMGSRVYAREAARRGDRITAMLSLETIGCYSDRPGSQSYPFPLSIYYPDRGDFIAFVGNYASRGLARRVVGVFREATRFPSEGAGAPAIFPGIDWSDQWGFWKEGYPALMVTDTALYRYAEYHSPHDTPEILDYDRLSRVVGGLTHVIADLAD